MTVAAASSTNWADAMDFHAAMVCPIGVPALACCALDGTIIENVDKQLVQLIVFVSMLPTVPGMLVLVEYSNDEIRPMVATALPALDWFSGRPACPRRPHCPRCPTHNTHTHNHTIAATAAVSAPGGAAGTQRSSGAEGDWRRRVRRVQRICGFGRAFAGLTDLAAAGSSSVARRAVRRAAVI